jgi:hypothetical protein
MSAAYLMVEPTARIIFELNYSHNAVPIHPIFKIFCPWN